MDFPISSIRCLFHLSVCPFVCPNSYFSHSPHSPLTLILTLTINQIPTLNPKPSPNPNPNPNSNPNYHQAVVFSILGFTLRCKCWRWCWWNRADIWWERRIALLCRCLWCIHTCQCLLIPKSAILTTLQV